MRSRAGLLPALASDQSAVLLAIEQERRVEFFAEFGHRWLDLKRTGKAVGDVLYPIPGPEMRANPKLEQNEAYK